MCTAITHDENQHRPSAVYPREKGFKMEALVFGARREAYGIDDVENPMTVRELREMLEGLDEDMIVICSHDNDYTFGSLSREATIRESRDGEYGIEFETIDVVFC